MTKQELQTIINNSEKYDHEATLDDIRHNLDSSIEEYIKEFGIEAFRRAFVDRLNELGYNCSLGVK